MRTVEGDTICAIATAPGEGAIGIVRLSGPDCLSLLQRVCGRPGFVPRRLTLVEVRDPRAGAGGRLEQALACFMPAPSSYSGEDMAELQAHGGVLNLQQLQRLLIELGARSAAPGEFTRRAFLNGRLDLTQAEAVAEIIGARSERALHNAQRLLEGELGRRLREARQELLELAAAVEASIDFAGEVELAEPAGLLHRLQGARARIAGLAGSYRSGRRLQGARVGLVGAVNAGKSSLFNQLLGRQRALVCSEPGTTRDYLEAEVSWQGHRLLLLDSAGWREAAQLGELERAGGELARAALRDCDLLLEVIDLADPGDSRPVHPELAGPRLRVGNKVDLLDPARRPGLPEGVLPVSALTGEGLEALRARLLGELFDSPEEETLRVTQQRHWEALRRAQLALEGGEAALAAELGPELVVEHLREALGALAGITGEGFSEAVLDEIFEKFCIGK